MERMMSVSPIPGDLIVSTDPTGDLNGRTIIATSPVIITGAFQTLLPSSESNWLGLDRSGHVIAKIRRGT